MEQVTYTREEPSIGILTLCHPETLNAMDETMAKAFRKKVNEIDANSLRVLIVTGAGKAFSAGGNLDMLQKKIELSKEENHRRMIDFYDSFLCVRSLGVPLIAAIHGHSIGAGFCLALACDIRVIAEKAKLGLTFTKLGLHPGMGATYFLPQVAGAAVAYELLLTGRIILGSDAQKYNLTHHVLPSEQVLEKAKEIALEISECGPLATNQLLQSLRQPAVDLSTQLEREATCQSLNYASAEFAEGVQAIKEKRKANF